MVSNVETIEPGVGFTDQMRATKEQIGKRISLVPNVYRRRAGEDVEPLRSLSVWPKGEQLLKLKFDHASRVEDQLASINQVVTNALGTSQPAATTAGD